MGVDCSGLVQAVLAAGGVQTPRDSDQQLVALGAALAFNDRAAGDIVFFPGHVGILVAGDRLLHANAHWMAVVEEPLADVIARIGDGAVTGVRRTVP
jgi:cell wall-associated NlpC family hydrolase